MKSFLIVAMVLLFLGGMVFGASFVPVQESTYCNSDAETEADIPEPNYFSDRHDNWGGAVNSSVSHTDIQIGAGESVDSDSSSGINFAIITEGTVHTNNKLQVTVSSQADVGMTTALGVRAYAWNGAATVQPGVATGNYYRIDPQAGEAVGDPVRVVFEYSAILAGQAGIGSSYSAIMSGGWAGDDLLIAVNSADMAAPATGEIVHRVTRKDVPGNYTDHFEFQAEVGDVIGIHCGAESTAYTGTNGGAAQGSVSSNMSLTINDVFDPSRADFDGSGRVDMADLALFASAWLWQEPVNDVCENAEEVQLDTHYTGNTSDGATGSHWYTFTPSAGDFYTVSVCDGEPYMVELYEQCVGGEPLSGTYEECWFTVWMDAGQDYFLQVSEFGPQPPADYDLIVTQGAPAPDNDLCQQAEMIFGEGWAEGTTIGATGTDEGLCATGDVHDVWFEYTPEQDGDHVFLLHPTYGPFEGVLTVYDGNTCTPLPVELDCQVTHQGETEIMLSLTNGVPYLVRVGSDGPGAGPFGLEVFYIGGEE